MTLDVTARRMQAEAITAIADIEIGFDGEVRTYLGQVVERRRRLLTILTLYQAFLHDRVYDPWILSSDAEKAAEARNLKVACIVADAQIRQHLKDWPSTKIRDNWEAYRTAARLVGSQLKGHIIAEADKANALLD